MKLSIPKETLYVAGGYALFLLVFFVLGVTKLHFEAFVAIGLLTGFYAGLVKLAKKILAG